MTNPRSTILLQMTFHSVYGWTAFCCTHTPLPIHLLRNMQVASLFWLSWMLLQWAQGCMYLFETEYYMGMCSGLGLLGHMVTLFLRLFHSSSFFNTTFSSCFSRNPYWLLQSTWIPPWMNSQNVSTLQEAASTICMLTCGDSYYRAISFLLPRIHAIFSNRPSTS